MADVRKSVLKGALRKLNNINLNYLLFDIIITEAGSFNFGEYIMYWGLNMKRRKHICIIIALFVVMCIAALAAFILIRNSKTSSARLPDLSEKKYEQFHSDVDMDNDGLDDQVDILQGVKDYINTKPVYKSQYYSGGYPDDGYGVL